MPPHIFIDRDGIERCVSWRPEKTIAIAAGGREESFPAGFQFECSALFLPDTGAVLGRPSCDPGRATSGNDRSRDGAVSRS